MSSNHSRPLLPLFLTVFIDMLGVGIAIPVLAAVFLNETGGALPAGTPFATRTLLYGLLLAAYPIAQFFGAPILGALSDHRGRKPILLISLAGTGIGYLLFALGIYWQSLPLLFVSRILDGFTGGNIAIAMSAIADISDRQNKTKNFGLMGTAFGMGFILGPFLGGELSSPDLVPWFTLATPFFATAALTFINILLCAYFLPETLKKPVHTPLSLLTGMRHLTKAFTTPPIRTMFIVVFLLGLGFNFFTQFFQVFLIERFAFTEVDTGRLFGYIGIWIAVTQGILTRPVSARFAPEAVIRVVSLGLAVMLLTLIFPTKSMTFYLLMPFIAICQGLLMPNMTSVVSNLAGPDAQGEIMGINQSVQSAAQSIPPLVAGLLTGVALELPILCGSIITLVAWAIFTWSFRSPRKAEVVHAS